MLDPREIYEIDRATEAEVSHSSPGTGPVLVHALHGFIDAGGAGRLLADHLVAELPTRRLVTFDADQLIDYRLRRPAMTFDTASWVDYADPELVVDLVRDESGTPFLLMHGLEPDMQWERYVAAVRGLVERYDVPLTVGVQGIPMGVPHTRPVSVTAHATRSALVADHRPWVGRVQVPGSASALLEMRLGQSGHDALGFSVNVPHYLARLTYPTAALAALEQVERSTGLVLGSSALLPAAAATMSEVEHEIAQTPELAAMVRTLEQRYDSVVAGIGPPGLLPTLHDLPTADELGEEFQRYLASQPGTDTPETPEDDVPAA
ncbi:MAG: PAC2 family protein [Micrococcales bacterium]|nr:PAC2 family protein [Micrococcales bacterium]